RLRLRQPEEEGVAAGVLGADQRVVDDAREVGGDLPRHAEELAEVALAHLEQGLEVVQLELVVVEERRDLLALLLLGDPRAARLLLVVVREELLLARGVDALLEGAGVLRLLEQVVERLGGGGEGQRARRGQDPEREQAARAHERLRAGAPSLGAGTGTVKRS